MRVRFSLFVVMLAFLTINTLHGQITFTDTGFANEKVISGFTAPTGFAFAPDGRIFVWEKAGRVRIVKNGVILATPFINISGHVNNSGDRGLLGLALDPNFATNGYVYLAYVFENGGNTTSTAARTERVTRVQADPNNKDRALPGETVILGSKSSLPCKSGEDCLQDDVNAHTIDHLAFGPDGKLYLSAGDGGDWRSATTGSLRAQNQNSLNGKVLRINKDGSAPTDNPFYDGTNSPRSKVFDYGLRNPFRYTFGPNGELIIGDVGWTKYEEINIGKGKNFGWPCYEGAFTQPSFQSAYQQCRDLAATSVAMPNYYYQHVTDIGGCIIMGPYLQNAPYAAKYNHQLYFADFSNKWLKRATLDASGKITGITSFATALNTPVFLAEGPDHNLYWLSIGTGTIYRIRYTGSGNRAPSAAVSASPSAGLSPLDVNFSSAGSSDPDGNTLTYSWTFGDGTTSSSPNPIHRYTATGVKKFTATLTVKDTAGATGQNSVVITLGSTPPRPTIAKPANNATVNPGAVVAFSGSATDAEDGTIPPGSLLWTEILHHNTHTHQIKQVTGSSGSFTADLPDTIDKYWYELQLKATDSAGVSTTKTVLININYVQGGGSSCTVKTLNPSITICTPANGATVKSPVHFVVKTTNSAGITGMKIYVDNVGAFTTTAGSIDTNLPMAIGTRHVVVQSWDKAGRVLKEPITITVSP
jgi:glucose/arabinose dehydrogenase/chitodextrinase